MSGKRQRTSPVGGYAESCDNDANDSDYDAEEHADGTEEEGERGQRETKRQTHSKGRLSFIPVNKLRDKTAKMTSVRA